MREITTCLAFKEHAEEAVKLYVSLFKNSRIVDLQRYGDGGPLPKGSLMQATFELDGRAFQAMDGGPTFSFAEGMSLVALCDTQEEIDRLWDKLTEGGGKPGPCGWLTDHFGVSWQIVPVALGKMLTDARSGNAAKAMEAMLKMGKIDIGTLEKAYKS